MDSSKSPAKKKSPKALEPSRQPRPLPPISRGKTESDQIPVSRTPEKNFPPQKRRPLATSITTGLGSEEHWKAKAFDEENLGKDYLRFQSHVTGPGGEELLGAADTSQRDWRELEQSMEHCRLQPAHSDPGPYPIPNLDPTPNPNPNPNHPRGPSASFSAPSSSSSTPYKFKPS